MSELQKILRLSIDLIAGIIICDNEGVSNTADSFSRQEVLLELAIEKVAFAVFQPAASCPAALLEISAVEIVSALLNPKTPFFSVFEISFVDRSPLSFRSVIVFDSPLAMRFSIDPIGFNDPEHFIDIFGVRNGVEDSFAREAILFPSAFINKQNLISTKLHRNRVSTVHPISKIVTSLLIVVLPGEYFAFEFKTFDEGIFVHVILVFQEDVLSDFHYYELLFWLYYT